MDFFADQHLNTHLFAAPVRQGTHDLSDLLIAVANTHCAAIESTHFLIVLAGLPGSELGKWLYSQGITLADWTTGLSQGVTRIPLAIPPAHLTRDALHESALTMLETAGAYCEQFNAPRLTEPILVCAALQHLTPSTREVFESVGIDPAEWSLVFERIAAPVEAVVVFSEEEKQALMPDTFTPAARKVLSLLRDETESLGYPQADPRHLLLALLEREGGALQYGLHLQGIAPNKVQEAVFLSLRGKARRTRSVVPLDREHCQLLLQRIFILAGELAGRDHAPIVSEVHLVRAFCAIDSTARRILEDEKVSVVTLRDVLEHYTPDEEEAVDEVTIADIETVRTRLGERLVGQDDAIDRILPYIQRMRFGFLTEGRPVAVLFFCGQSGSGKTEMAKELARAVYGSDEKLIFLEMGQFNAPESMNIFVGAPPGYVGFGQGKLTNGLRDQPQSVVLFDEVEKANPKVLDALLRFLDEGRIDDPAGPVRDGSQCIVILTSNIGADELSKLAMTVRDDPNRCTIIRTKLRKEFIEAKFRVEFLNRVDELILFQTLTQADYTEIARRATDHMVHRLQHEHRIEVLTDEDVPIAIGRYCAEMGEGARAVHRLVLNTVVTPVIDYVIRRNPQPPVRLRVRQISPMQGDDIEPVGQVEAADPAPV